MKPSIYANTTTTYALLMSLPRTIHVTNYTVYQANKLCQALPSEIKIKTGHCERRQGQI